MPVCRSSGFLVNDDERGLHADYEEWLDFGTWEQIFYGGFDGRRRKRVLVKIVGESRFRVRHFPAGGG